MGAIAGMARSNNFERAVGAPHGRDRGRDAPPTEGRSCYSGGVYSCGATDPPAKKNFSISVSRNLRASGSIGDSRYSLINIV